jgi:hypothetical protein
MEFDLEVGIPEAIQLNFVDWSYIKNCTMNIFHLNAGISMAMVTLTSIAKRKLRRRWKY